MEFKLLGPFEVVVDGRPVGLGGRQRRTLLAVLVVHNREPVTTDRLIDELWGDAAPLGARKSVQAHVAHLRRTLNNGAEVLTGASDGYRLDIDPDSIDSHRFAALCREGRALSATSPEQAAAILTEALSMFRGNPLVGLADDAFSLRVEASRLEEMRLEAMEGRLDALLGTGDTGTVVVEAERLVAEHPLRERLWAILMTALYGSGRQAEALRAYSRVRQLLAGELGIEPSAALQQLEQRILDGAADLNPSRIESGAVSLTTQRVLRNPYKGLRPFDEADSSDFFGREALIRRLLDRIETRPGARLTVLIGPSGSGKSSVVRAGLVPALRERETPVGVMFPGSDSMEALGKAIGDASGEAPADMRAILEGRLRLDRPVVIVVDQCEELFTLSPDQRTVEGFLDLVAADDYPIRWVMTIRADFLDRLLKHRRLSPLLEGALVLIPTLDDDEIRAVITGPAARVGLYVEPELVSSVIADVKGRPTALPLLQFALTDSFVRRRSDSLTLSDYERAGGISGSLARRAEEVFAPMEERLGDQVQRLLLQLVAVTDEGELARRRVPRSHLVGEEATVTMVLERFGAQRLLTFDQDPATGAATVEVAHEALISEWPRFSRWVADASDDLRMARRLGGAVSEWESSGRDPSFLLSGARLNEMEGWVESSHIDIPASGFELVTASRTVAKSAAQTAARRRRVVLTTVSVAAVMAIAMAVFAFDQASEAREQARLATVRGLVAASAASLVADPELASLLALQAVLESGDTVLPEAEEALHRAVLADRLLARAPNGGNGIAHFSPTGDSFVAMGGDVTTIQIWSVDPVMEKMTLVGHRDFVIDVVYSSDGAQLASTSSDGTVRVWNAETGEIEIVFEVEGPIPLIPVFSNDGTRLAASSTSGVVWVWDLASQQLTWELEPPEGTFETVNLEFSPDGSVLAVAPFGPEDSRQSIGAQVWDMTSGELITVVAGHQRNVFDLGFTPDGTRLLTAGFDATVKEWDTATWTETRTFYGAGASVIDLDISGDGTRVAVTGLQGMAQVFDLETFEVTHVLLGHSGMVDGVDFSPDGNTLLTASTTDRTNRLWDLREEASYELLALPGASRPHPAGVAFSPDGSRLAASRDVGHFTIWQFPEGHEVRTFPGPGEVSDVIAFDPLGEFLVTAGPEAIALFDSDGELVRNLSKVSSSRPASSPDEERLFFGVPSPHAAFSPDGERLITTGVDGTHLWIRPFTDELLLLSELPGSASSFHPSGDLVALSIDEGTVGFTGLVEVRDLVSGEVVAEVRGHQEPVWRLGFSPDGRWLVTGSVDTTAVIWDVATFELQHRLVGHQGAVLEVAFDPTRAEVATASDDGTVKIWSLETGELLLTLPGIYSDMDYTPDGAYLAGVGPGSSLIVHIRDVHQLAAEAQRRLTRWWTPEECERFLASRSCPAPPEPLVSD